MNIKKPKIKIGHNLRVPKRKKTKLNPLRVRKKNLSKLHGTVKTRKKLQKTNKKKSHNKKNSLIIEKIKMQKQIQQKDSEELKKNIKKLQTLIISFSGLEQLSEKSIKNIQERRQKICAENQDIVKRISITAKKLSEYESKYKNTS
ncbi:hypothetical protein [Nitrosopumilus sp.]|uniref:hypothetical protein n=1 Tax=Nitrosopumilus sp. TaxID=2024843 RepID=UPI003D0CD147